MACFRAVNALLTNVKDWFSREVVMALLKANASKELMLQSPYGELKLDDKVQDGTDQLQ